LAVNQAVFQGRLGADAEVRETQGGKTITRFRIANTRRFTANGQQQEKTTWMSIVAWNGVASGIIDYLVKGKEVTVVGSLEQNDWEDKEGNKRTTIEINAREIHLGADPRGGGDDEAPARKPANRGGSKPAPRKSGGKGKYAEYEDEVDGDDGDDTNGVPW
jgi:single-strand DNA-binding protein